MLMQTHPAVATVPAEQPPLMPRSPVLRAALAVIALIVLVLPILIVATTPRVVVQKRPHVVISHRVVPKAELPPVEPVQLQAVDPEDARAINASIPFVDGPVPPARAFHVFGSPADQARAIDCLAAAVYYEAGDDAVGERAVAQVILNRVRHPAFPKTVCGVVFQGSERSTGCQFTFSCDGALLRYSPSPAAWQRAREVARLALSGSVYKPVGLATHYHTDWVVPYWSASLDKIAAVHTHLFFRWAGWWGTPPAFNRGYLGAEPNVAQLARLSPVHIGTGGPGGELAALGEGGPVLEPEQVPANAVPTAMAGDENSFMLTLPKGINSDSFPALAIRTCGDRPYCKFMAWADAGKTPSKLPLNSGQVASMSFSYLRDQANGFAKALWNCEQFKRPTPVQCMRAQPLAKEAAAPPPVVTTLPAATDAKLPAALTGVRRKGDPLPAGTRPTVSFTLPGPKVPVGPAPTPTPAR